MDVPLRIGIGVDGRCDAPRVLQLHNCQNAPLVGRWRIIDIPIPNAPSSCLQSVKTLSRQSIFDGCALRWRPQRQAYFLKNTDIRWALLEANHDSFRLTTQGRSIALVHRRNALHVSGRPVPLSGRASSEGFPRTCCVQSNTSHGAAPTPWASSEILASSAKVSSKIRIFPPQTTSAAAPTPPSGLTLPANARILSIAKRLKCLDPLQVDYWSAVVSRGNGCRLARPDVADDDNLCAL